MGLISESKGKISNQTAFRSPGEQPDDQPGNDGQTVAVTMLGGRVIEVEVMPESQWCDVLEDLATILAVDVRRLTLLDDQEEINWDTRVDLGIGISPTLVVGPELEDVYVVRTLSISELDHHDEGFAGWFYFQTAAGGPERGYLCQSESPQGNEPAYSVFRTWGTMFEIKRLEGQSIWFRPATTSSHATVAVVPFDDPDNNNNDSDNDPDNNNNDNNDSDNDPDNNNNDSDNDPDNNNNDSDNDNSDSDEQTVDQTEGTVKEVATGTWQQEDLDDRQGTNEADETFKHVILGDSTSETKTVRFNLDGVVVSANLMPGTSMADLRAELFECFGERCVKDVRFLMKGETIVDTYVFTADVDIVTTRRLRGGVQLVKKKHMKKDDALKELKQKAMSVVAKGVDVAVPPDVEFPQEFADYIESCKKKVDRILLLKASGKKIVETGLKDLSKEQLETLRDIMKIKPGERRGSSEERVMRCIDVIFPFVSMMEASKTAIDAAIQQILKDLVSVYVDEFSTFSGGYSTFDNQSFVDLVSDELAERKGYAKADAKKKSAKKETDSEDIEGIEQKASDKVCTVM